MGIINATPDSFYKGNIDEDMLQLATTMITDGADILDIGGQSTRPSSERISVDEEIHRVVPVISAIHQAFPETIISVDTYNSIVAKEAVEAGAAIVNDISGGTMDAKMLQTVADLQVPYVCMHIQGSPENMQHEPKYNNVVTEVLDFCYDKIAECRKAGIKDIIIDPGFGFGKSLEHNLKMLADFDQFSQLGYAVLAGMSRKSMLGKLTGRDTNDRVA
ncbi:MAG: dihydropteroate synthase, partial [Ferruginibacter sp.]